MNTPTPSQISADVARGLEIRQLQTDLKAELKAIETRLEQAGLAGEQILLQDEDREGRQFLARSPQAGLAIPVVFESDQIVNSFAEGTPLHAKLQEFFQKHPGPMGMDAFYGRHVIYERRPADGQAVRRLAREFLGTAAPEFVSRIIRRNKHGIPISRTVIAWDHARPLE
jgi:hypothetical protein